MSDVRTGWYCYPWNLHDPAATLDEMRATGMDQLTLATSYHAGKFIQPRDPRQRVYFPEDGTVYFRARDERYGRLKPVVASITHEQDVLDEACRADRLPVRGWTVLAHNSRLGWLHPDAVTRNAWGDPYYYSLCPANPDVQDYAVALCADLADVYPLETLLLEAPSWLHYEHGYHHEFAQVAMTEELGRLLGLCFCDSCAMSTRDAGIDLARLRRAVAKRGDALLAGKVPVDSTLDEELGALHAWRQSVVTALCRRIRDAVRREVGVRVISTCQPPHPKAYLEGMDLRALAQVGYGLELPIYQPTPAAALGDFGYVREIVGDAADLSVILRPGHPDMKTEADLTATIDALVLSGVTDISFFNYGLLPAAQIDWATRATGRLKAGADAA